MSTDKLNAQGMQTTKEKKVQSEGGLGRKASQIKEVKLMLFQFIHPH